SAMLNVDRQANTRSAHVKDKSIRLCNGLAPPARGTQPIEAQSTETCRLACVLGQHHYAQDVLRGAKDYPLN
ncbi:hypothetical protein ACQV5M_19625, partial [Leptospira sp. SA-E8]|uniref:hypothetical protein n=1 Tax=Leptospira sp. SA-E8 TaxID=3422259 RepID=UPI003EBA722A